MIHKYVDAVIYILSITATALALGILVYTQILYSPPLPDNVIETQKLIEAEKQNSFPKEFELKKIIVNLKSRSKRLRFLEIKIFLVPFGQGQKKILEQNKDLIYDSIIDITSGMEPAKLNTLSGKLILQNRIRNNINRLIKIKIIKDIHLTRYVII